MLKLQHPEIVFFFKSLLFPHADYTGTHPTLLLFGFRLAPQISSCRQHLAFGVPKISFSAAKVFQTLLWGPRIGPGGWRTWDWRRCEKRRGRFWSSQKLHRPDSLPGPESRPELDSFFARVSFAAYLMLRPLRGTPDFNTYTSTTRATAGIVTQAKSRPWWESKVPALMYTANNMKHIAGTTRNLISGTQNIFRI